jgi:molybdenum cofactor cytidylyltransferase
MATKISALVLAAGASERMTEPKMLLPFGERTILTATLDAVEKSGACDETIVVLGANADDVEPTLGASGARVVRNPEPEAGLSSSIRAGVGAASGADAYMVLLGDHPLLAGDTVKRLAEKFRGGGKGICVPVFQGVMGHPVFFASRYRDELLALTGDEGARRLMMKHPDDVLDVHVAEVGVVFDVDDEEDYDEALRLAGLPPREKPEPVPEPAEPSDAGDSEEAPPSASENGSTPEDVPSETL